MPPPAYLGQLPTWGYLVPPPLIPPPTPPTVSSECPAGPHNRASLPVPVRPPARRPLLSLPWARGAPAPSPRGRSHARYSLKAGIQMGIESRVWSQLMPMPKGGHWPAGRQRTLGRLIALPTRLGSRGARSAHPSRSL